MTEVAGTGGVGYRAFISYSHRDATFGRRLHRRLEAYAVPRRLVGRPGARGPVPQRLAPIFRDREELPAADDLSAQVRAALQVSDSLVVVCSPDAAASPWVAREVELFRALHPDRPILAALIAGEPAQAFPAPLRRDGSGQTAPIEPLAADFRDGRDGPRLALLKLVAGIVGVGLDQLVQRDAARRLRRVTAVTVAAVAAMLAMGAVTVFAVNARVEAERQRSQAEGMVEFMLTDLRDRLKGVGRLDVLTAVNERALKYYADQDLKRLPVASLERRARVLHAMGEDDETRGDLLDALKKFNEAKRTTGVLLAAAPSDPQRIFDHAQSEYWVAFIAWRRGQIARAEAGFRRYAKLAGELLKDGPSNPDWRMEAGYADSNLGMLMLRDKGDAAQAEALFLRANDHFKAAAAARPSDADITREMADGDAWLADSQREQGHFDLARASREGEARLLKTLLAGDPQNAAYARDLLGNALSLAQIDLDQGQPAVGARRLQAAYAQAGVMATDDPSDEKMAKQRIVLGLSLARMRLAEGAEADAARESLSDCTRPIVVADPELLAFCSIITRRVTIYAGASAPTTPIPIPHTRRSARWGIDFGREIQFLSNQRRRNR